MCPAREHANAFSELTDPVEQRRRLEAQVAAQAAAVAAAREAAAAEGVAVDDGDDAPFEVRGVHSYMFECIYRNYYKYSDHKLRMGPSESSFQSSRVPKVCGRASEVWSGARSVQKSYNSYGMYITVLVVEIDSTDLARPFSNPCAGRTRPR